MKIVWSMQNDLSILFIKKEISWFDVVKFYKVINELHAIITG